MNRKTKIALAVIALSVIAGSASAGAIGNESQPLYTWLMGFSFIQEYGVQVLLLIMAISGLYTCKVVFMDDTDDNS